MTDIPAQLDGQSVHEDRASAASGTGLSSSTEPKVSALRASIPDAEVLTALCQYRDDLRYPPTPDSIERRLAMVTKLIAKLERQS